jgi:hypothetical protein
MTADAALPGLPTIAVRRAPMQDGAMLYDAVRLSNADPALFDTRNCIEKGGAKRTPAGRYLWTGEDRTRAFREWRLLHDLHAAALPVPAPVAARYHRHGPAYVADLITERIALGIIPLRADVHRRHIFIAIDQQANQVQTWRGVVAEQGYSNEVGAADATVCVNLHHHAVRA